MSNLINKVKDALHSDKDKSTEQPEGTHGHHNSKVANTADPRIDSDRDHRAAPGSTTTGTGTYSGTTGSSTTNPLSSGTGHHTTTTGTTGAAYGTGPGSNTAGPHKSDMMNKADPRVDSDMDGSRNMGANQGGMSGTGGYGSTTGTTAGMTGTHHAHAGNTGTGMTGTSGLAGTSGSGIGGRSNVTGVNDPEGTHGPHSSRMGNAADPRVDSDRDASRTMGGATTGTHSTGAGYGSGTTTGTGAGLGSGTAAGYGTGPGPAPNTAGPHKSDMMNKVDPRVDSDLDNSKTVGGDKTYQS